MTMMDISEWFQKNYREVWDEWVMIAPHDTDVDFEDWVYYQYFELYLEYLEDETEC